ncbi:hypothetical protein D3C84_924990 [compost metagenome]
MHGSAADLEGVKVFVADLAAAALLAANALAGAGAEGGAQVVVEGPHRLELQARVVVAEKIVHGGVISGYG